MSRDLFFISGVKIFNGYKVYVYRDLYGYIYVYARSEKEADERLKELKLDTPTITYVGILAFAKAEYMQPKHIKDMKKVRI